MQAWLKGLLLLQAVLLLAGCQSLERRQQRLVQDRVQKLSALSTWTPAWCEVEARLTQPAAARYEQMFPLESEQIALEAWAFTWKARESRCEISALDDAAVVRSYQGFVEVAMCLLMQAHWVNSPFDEMFIQPEQIMRDPKDGRVLVRMGADGEVGLYLDPERLSLETRTKSRGTIKAEYSQVGSEWLPMRLEQELSSSRLVVDSIEYDTQRVGARRMLKSLWISVGEEKPVRHSQLVFKNCQPY